MSNLDSIFQTHPELGTQRLFLRALRDSDAPTFLEHAANLRVLEYIPKPPMQSLDEATASIAHCHAMFRDRTGIAWAGEHRETGAMIGTVALNRIETQHKRAEIGGSLATRYWGTGIAPEALQAVVEFGFGALDLHTIEARVNPANRSTIAWLGSFGFVKEAHYKEFGFWKGEYLDLAVFTLFNPRHA